MSNPHNASPSDDDELFEFDGTDHGLIKEGEHRIRCVGLEKDESLSGKPCFKWTFVVVEGSEEGKEFVEKTWLTPNGMFKVAEVCEALAIMPNEKKYTFKKSDAIGQECKARIRDDTYNGRVSSKAEFFEKL